MTKINFLIFINIFLLTVLVGFFVYYRRRVLFFVTENLALQKKCRKLQSEDFSAKAKSVQMQQVWDSMTEGVLALDAESKIVLVNPAALRWLDLESSEAEGRFLAEIIRDADLDIFISRIKNSSCPIEGEIDVHRDHGVRFIRLVGNQLFLPTENPGVLLVLHDVTELKRLENLRRDFVANVSHELKTPLTAIRGFAEELAGSSDFDPDECRHFSEIIVRQSERLTHIVDDLMMLAKIERDQSRKTLSLDNINLQPFMQRVVDTCQTRFAKQSPRIRIQSECDMTISANARLLEQAITNLVENAVKYAGGEICVGARLLGNDLEICVADQGEGIAREHLSRIFERFYRVDSARTREAGGSGLGLALVKHIAEVHGGRVSVESILGEGTKFLIYLPRQ